MPTIRPWPEPQRAGTRMRSASGVPLIVEHSRRRTRGRGGGGGDLHHMVGAEEGHPMRDDRNPTMQTPRALQAFRWGADAVIIRRPLSAAAEVKLARAIAQETAEAVASFPRGDFAPPVEVMRLLRMPRYYSQRVVEARARLTP